MIAIQINCYYNTYYHLRLHYDGYRRCHSFQYLEPYSWGKRQSSKSIDYWHQQVCV